MERRLRKSQVNSPSGLKADRLPGMPAKDQSRRRHRSLPLKGLRNVKKFELLKRAEKTAVLIVAPECVVSQETAAEIGEQQIRRIKRIMREASQKYDLNNMVDGYIKVYERLNGGNPLL